MAKKEFPVLKTERLTLRQLEKSDAPALVAIMNDEEVSRHLMGNPERTTLKQEQNFIQSRHKQFLNGHTVDWVICDKITGTPMGTIGISLSHMERMHNKASAGFFLARDFWGMGYRPRPSPPCWTMHSAR